MELNVKIHSVGTTQNVTDTFSKREFIVETQEEYKQYLLLQVTKDKCGLLDSYKKGDNAIVSLNLRGRLWTNPQGEEKCFNTLECWKISKTEQSVNNIEVKEPISVVADSDDTGLPF